MNKILITPIAALVFGAFTLNVLEEGKHADAKEHSHHETHVPAYPLTNGFFTVTSTSATLL